MITLIITFLLSTLVAIIVTPIVRGFAPTIGSVDLPSGRRVNKEIVPRLGGIAILLGFLSPLLVLTLYENWVSLSIKKDMWRFIGLLGGSISLAAMGAIDDIKGSRAIYKLSAQILVAVWAYFCGFQISQITLPFVGTLEMGIFALPITVLWIVGIVNAVNLIDGLDGLAAGVSFLVCIVNFTIGLLSGNILLALYAVALGGALIGFLIFNFNPATIFMGDTGSLLIGYILATTSLIGTKGGTAVALLIPILAMGLPIFDTLLAIVRRAATNQPIWSADNGHIHHRLLEMGLTHKKTVLVLYAASMLFTCAAIAIYLSRNDWYAGVVLLAASLLVFVMMRVVGIFQIKKLKETKLSLIHDDTFSATLEALPEFILGADKVQNTEELKQLLDIFCEEVGLTFGRCETETPHPFNNWTWEPTEGQNLKGRNFTSSRYSTPLSNGINTLNFEFSWTSDEIKISAHMNGIFFLLTETIKKTLDKLDSQSPTTDATNQ